MADPSIPPIPVAGVDLRQREKEEQFRRRAIQEKLETLSCAIYVGVASDCIKGLGKAMEPSRAVEMAKASLDAALAMGQTMYGVTAVRATEVPPVKETQEPF